MSHTSREAESTAARQGVVEARLLVHLLQEGHETREQLMDVRILLSVETTSAVGFTARRGPASFKHMDLKYLSLQGEVWEGASKLGHGQTDVLLADFLTQP